VTWSSAPEPGCLAGIGRRSPESTPAYEGELARGAPHRESTRDARATERGSRKYAGAVAAEEHKSPNRGALARRPSSSRAAVPRWNYGSGHTRVGTPLRKGSHGDLALDRHHRRSCPGSPRLPRSGTHVSITAAGSEVPYCSFGGTASVTRVAPRALGFALYPGMPSGAQPTVLNSEISKTVKGASSSSVQISPLRCSPRRMS
jgi:hypothetical protein